MDPGNRYEVKSGGDPFEVVIVLVKDGYGLGKEGVEVQMVFGLIWIQGYDHSNLHQNLDRVRSFTKNDVNG